MFYYKYKDKYLFSFEEHCKYDKINAEDALDKCQELYFLTNLNKEKSKKSFAITHPSDLYIKNENMDILCLKNIHIELPEKLKNLINSRRIKAVNTEYDNCEESLYIEQPKKKKVNILALGDVGSTLLIGLKLLGAKCIESIGIYDRSKDKIQRWEYEMNQTSLPFEYDDLPYVHGITKDELFNCDMFVFCASKGVPPLDTRAADVRMVQFEENSKLIREYAEIAAGNNFKGIFGVVSDPVDLLCKTVLIESRGALAPEQIKGYGLGVMNARAMYYAKKYDKFSKYLTEGRAFGPHGRGLVIADSTISYDDELSEELTNLTENANLEVRKTGFKPYIAPALSSGAISIICTLEGKWHYSSNFIGGVYIGAKNRNLPAGIEFEKINMPDKLFSRLKETYKSLEQIL